MIALQMEPCWQDSPIRFSESLPPVDSSPCEAGCPHLDKCQNQELSCQAYHNYANSRKFESSSREPSPFFYEQTFETPSKSKGVFVRTEQKQPPKKPEALSDIPVLAKPATHKKKEKAVKAQATTKTQKEKPVLSEKAVESIAVALKEIQRPQGAASIEKLANLAMSGTSSAAAAAAQVLLSAWNGRDWQLSVSDLGYLDPVNRGAALDVIDLRANAGMEPHTQIPNGNQVFSRLANKWQRYRIDNRHKEECRDCYGTGEVFANLDDENDTSTTVCPYCQGNGYQ